jgi:hypothetical protein
MSSSSPKPTSNIAEASRGSGVPVALLRRLALLGGIREIGIRGVGAELLGHILALGFTLVDRLLTT